MKTRQAGCGALLAAFLEASIAFGASADTPPAQVDAPRVPDGTDVRLQAALRQSVREHVSRARLDGALTGYSLSPSLIQLRRYVGPAPERVKLVCIVGLALKSDRGLVADVRGHAASVGTSPFDVVDAAAHAAVERLPGALVKLRGHETGAVAER